MAPILSHFTKLFQSPSAPPAIWADEADLRQAGLIPGRVAGGCSVGAWRQPATGRRIDLVDDSLDPVVVTGPCRSGKTTGLAVPTLLRWRGSAIVFDAHGEACALTAGWRAVERGNRVLHVTLGSPNTRDRFNVLDAIRVGTPFEFEDASLIARELIPEDGTDLPGTAQARSLLAVYIVDACRRPRYNLQRVRAVASLAIEPELRSVMAWLPETPAEADAIEAAHDLLRIGRPLRALQAHVQARLEVLDVPGVAEGTSRSTFSLNDLTDASRPTTLYVDVATPGNRATLALARLLIVAATRHILRRRVHRHRTLLLLDDAGSLGALSVAEDLGEMAAHGIKAYWLVQGSRQLQTLLGPDLENKLKRIGHHVILPPSSRETAAFLAERAVSGGDAAACASRQEIQRLLHCESSLARSNNGVSLLLVSKRVKPVRGRLIPYFADNSMPAALASLASVPLGGFTGHTYAV